MWITIAIDRESQQVIDFEIGPRSSVTFNNLFSRLRLLNIKRIHTDGHSMYNHIPKRYNPTTTKDQTTYIESVNSTVRDFVGRFHRKTKQVSKKVEMVQVTLKLFFMFRNKNIKDCLDYNKNVLPLFNKIYCIS